MAQADERVLAILCEAYVPRRLVIERCNRQRAFMGMDAWSECQRADNETSAILTTAEVLFGDPAWHEVYDAGTRAWEAADA